MSETPKEKTVLTAKPDAMANLAPAQVTRPVVESEESRIEVISNPYKRNSSGMLLDHRLYVEDDPSQEFRFCSDRAGIAEARKQQGYQAVKDSESKEIKVKGMTLCKRPVIYKQMHDDNLKERSMSLARKKGVSDESLREDNPEVFANVRVEKHANADRFVSGE